MSKVDVFYKNSKVGEAYDNGKTIIFNKTPEAQEAIDEINKGSIIGVSSRQIGVVAGNVARVVDTKSLELIPKNKNHGEN